ncbi:MAG: hypothetical protein FJW90_05695 [Actinobacteria bacterium]|nr:hypothetical protein [Actinomycetota bacterium]
MQTAGTDKARARALLAGATFACALALSLALTLLAAADAGAKKTGGVKADGTCAPQPQTLAPKGDSSKRFTMLLRVNQQVNVDEYTDFGASGLGRRIKPQDIFVINTRYEGSTPAEWSELATGLRNAFPCNRIAALNGMGLDPERSGYAFALLNHPSVYSLMTDFEPMDWDEAPRASWSYNAGVALKRIKKWNTTLARTIASSTGGAAKRGGLVPLDLPGWSYGQIAQDLDRKNQRLGDSKLGPLSVQTQDSCANGGASTFRTRAKQVFDQYVFRYVRKTVKRKVKKRKITVRVKIKKRARPNLNNLSLQISFSDTPNPLAGMAITKTSAKTAAACTAAGLKAGGGAFFFFASTDSMKLLFEQKQISSLRPPG